MTEETEVVPVLKDISTRTKEGKMLYAALAMLTTQVYTNKTPDEVVGMLHNLSKQMFNS